MRVVINSQLLAQELRLLNTIAPVKPALPILTNTLITANDALTFAATDLEIGFLTTCRAQIVEPGTITLPVKRLLDIIEQTTGDVQISSEKHHVFIQSGAFKSRLQALQPEDFPTLPTVTGDITTLHTATLQAMIGRVRYAVAEGGKYTVNGALLKLTEQGGALVATDGKRLALTTGLRAGATSVIVPAKALDALAIFSEPEVAFSQSDRHLFFQAGNRLLISRTLEAQFPAYERILPRDNDKVAVVERAALSAALRRVGLLSEDNKACYLSFSAEGIDLTSSSAEAGDAAERVAAQYEGDPLRVCCSWRYLLDFLEAASGQTVTVSLKDVNSAILLTDGDNYIAVVMAMRG